MMKNLLKSLLLLSLVLVVASLEVSAQAEITGTIIDEYNFPIDAAVITVIGNGTMEQVYSDPQGYYSIKPIKAGKYEVHINRTGYHPQQFSDVLVQFDQSLFFDVTMVSIVSETEFKVVEYRNPLITKGVPPAGLQVDGDFVAKLPTRNINDIVTISTGVFQADAGGPIFIRGARAGAVVYYVDGMRMEEINGVPSSAIDQLSVLTGAIPAKYGDTTGGVIVINTKAYSQGN